MVLPSVISGRLPITASTAIPNAIGQSGSLFVIASWTNGTCVDPSFQELNCSGAKHTDRISFPHHPGLEARLQTTLATDCIPCFPPLLHSIHKVQARTTVWSSGGQGVIFITQ